MHSNECLCSLEKFLNIVRTFVNGKFFLLTVVILLPTLTSADRMAVYPCVDFQAIRWVRDAAYCDQYYICHFGQPMSMPSCPAGQVWSNLALNCVPVHSRWDDCSHPPVATQPTDPTIKVKTQGEGVNLELPTYRVNNLLLPGKDAVVSTSRPKTLSNKQRVVKLEETRADVTTTQVPIRVIPLKQNSIPLVKKLDVPEKKETGSKNSYRAGSPSQRRRNEDKPDRRERQHRYTSAPPQTTTPMSTPAPTVRSTRAPTRSPFYPADTRQYNRRQQQENSSLVPSVLEAKLRHLDIDRSKLSCSIDLSCCFKIQVLALAL